MTPKQWAIVSAYGLGVCIMDPNEVPVEDEGEDICVPTDAGFGCDPLDPGSCDQEAGEVCDACVSVAETLTFQCAEGTLNTAKVGEPCGTPNGVYCESGLGCTDDLKCAKYCCSDLECGSTSTCESQEMWPSETIVDFGLGLCEEGSP